MNRKLNNITRSLVGNLENQHKEHLTEVEAFICNAKKLLRWAMEDEKELVKAGLPNGFINDVYNMCKHLKITSSLYEEQKMIFQEVKEVWEDNVTFAEQMKSKILVTLCRCSSIVSGTYTKLDKYLEKHGTLSVSGQLESLYDIALDNKGNLMDKGFTGTEFDRIKKTVEELHSMQVYLDNEEKNEKELELLRNKSYDFLKQGLEKIINMGIFTLSKESERLVGYQLAKKNI